ncbi:hypothetical protein CsSME_00005435 [Camellia sinensis var. sinensis]
MKPKALFPPFHSSLSLLLHNHKNPISITKVSSFQISKTLSGSALVISSRNPVNSWPCLIFQGNVYHVFVKSP